MSSASPSSASRPGGPRVFACSDIHTDFEENMAWVRSLSDVAFAADAVILAGDISDDLGVLETTLRLFASKFAHAFYVPGNHDLWIRRKGASGASSSGASSLDSMAKLDRVLRLCDECGVHTRPKLLAPPPDAAIHRGSRAKKRGVWVVPVLAWYHSSFDTEPDVPASVASVHPPERVMSDFKLCAWPEPLDPSTDSVARAIDAVNDRPSRGWGEFLAALRSGSDAEREADVLTFSHFLPRLELCPEKRMLFYPNLPKAVGSNFLLERIRNLRSHGGGVALLEEGEATVTKAAGAVPARAHVHVFGHTHFGWDATIEGVRYVQAPVSYPHEWKQRPGSLTVGPDSRGRAFDMTAMTDTPGGGGGGVEEEGGGAGEGARLDAPLCIWGGWGEDDATETREAAGEKPGFVEEMSARWSDHYKANPREPHNMELAWWVRGGRRGSNG